MAFNDSQKIRASAEVAADSKQPAAIGATRQGFALTAIQRGLIAESLMSPDKGINVEQVVWELASVPDTARFRAAWQSALDSFDALRIGFEWRAPGEAIRQRVSERVQLPFESLDCSAVDHQQQQLRLERFLNQQRRAGFDLSSTPLVRVALLRLSASRAVCVWTVHHAIVDAVSFALVLQHVWNTYAGRWPQVASGRAPRRFTEFLGWLQQQDLAPGVRHFQQLLSGFGEPTPLPLMESGDGVAQVGATYTQQRIGPTATAKLRTVATETGTTPNTLIQLAWAVLLSNYTGEADVVFGATWSGRPGTIEGAKEIVGPFINTLPVRVRLSQAQTVRQHLVSLRQQHLDARPFQHVPLAEIASTGGQTAAPRLLQSLVVFENERFYAQLPRWDDSWRGQRIWSRSQTGFPLVLAAALVDQELELELESKVGLYSADGATRLLADYTRILLGICDHLSTSPFAIPMLEPDWLASLTVAEVERELVPEQQVVLARIISRAEEQPQRLALQEILGESVVYAELARRVLQLSHVLRDNGVGPGTLVGLYVPRSSLAVVALMAVHAAGAAFVPVDPDDPPERVTYILRDANVKRLLVNRQTQGKLASFGSIELAIDGPAVEATRADGEWTFPAQDSLAYVLYTSGSTGEPKGVCISQSALGNHLAAAMDQFALVPQDRALAFAALTFDVALEELLPTLAAGATVILRNREMASSAREFFETVAREAITVINIPSAFWHQLVDSERSWPECLRLVVVGGERVSPEAHRKFREADTGHLRWMNGYGPTETTITSTCYDDQEGDHGSYAIPIGRPLSGVSHFVLDRYQRVMPPGAAGQLYIGGAGLALGYLNRDELTAQRFIAHPFRSGARLYATGDRVRVTPLGNYVFLDREDHQVKIRGFRVELGEVEAALRRCPGVSDAAVVVHKKRADGLLVGFVIGAGQVSEARLRQLLAASLPTHMVPSRLVVTASLPLTSAGKVDRAALAETQLEEVSGLQTGVTDDLLRSLLRIWSDVLGTPVADPASSFFDLGGNSLLVVRMFSEVERSLGRACNAVVFLKEPTANHLAELLRDAGERSPSTVVQLAAGNGTLRPVFFAPGLSGRETDLIHLAPAIAREIPIYALLLGGFIPAGDEPLRQVAKRLVDSMQQIQPRGPYALAGFSAGGVFALVIAEELRSRGQVLDFIGLIDCVPPRSVAVRSPLTNPRRLFRLSKTVLGRVRDILEEPGGLPGLWKRSRDAAERSAARWGLLARQRDLTVRDVFGDTTVQFSEREIEAMQRYLDAIERYEFERVSLDLVLFRTPLDPPEGPHEHDLGWRRITAGIVEIEDLGGKHSSLLTAAGCHELAARLELYLKPRIAVSPEHRPRSQPPRAPLAS